MRVGNIAQTLEKKIVPAETSPVDSIPHSPRTKSGGRGGGTAGGREITSRPARDPDGRESEGPLELPLGAVLSGQDLRERGWGRSGWAPQERAIQGEQFEVT